MEKSYYFSLFIDTFRPMTAIRYSLFIFVVNILFGGWALQIAVNDRSWFFGFIAAGLTVCACYHAAILMRALAKSK
jgi:hypothetical protein